MRALLLVDIQNDFLPGGALAVPGGDEIIAVANRLMPRYELVVATQDWHPPGHGSFASQHTGHDVGDIIRFNGLNQILWPDHCVQHTDGAALATDLHADGIHHVVPKGTDPTVDSYSGFFDNDRRQSTGLQSFLKDRGVDQLDIMGLATDYCVKFTALDACSLGLTVRVILDGIRGVEMTAGDCELAIEEMRGGGAEVIRADGNASNT